MSVEEADLLEFFLLDAKRDRWIGFLKSKKNRSKFIEALSHFAPMFRSEYLIKIPTVDQNAAGVFHVLSRLGAGDSCYAISLDGDVDGRILPLRVALEKTVGNSIGTILSCVPGPLLYYEGEDPGERYVVRSTRHEAPLRKEN